MIPDREVKGDWRSAGDKKEGATVVGNLIQKTMYMFLWTAKFHLNSAEVFCRLDLDTLFIAENMQAYLRVHNIPGDEPFYFGVLLTFWRNIFQDFPDGGAGICLTRGALQRLSQYLMPK